MPRRKAGNREFDFAYTDGTTGVRTRGTGTWPYPVATYGGEIVLVVDVDVPDCAHGTEVDWSIPYPELGAGPIEKLPLWRYAQPADTSAKLNGKGNFEISSVTLYFGEEVSGAEQPNTDPPEQVATCQISLGRDPGSGSLWQFIGNLPVTLAGVTRLGPGSAGVTFSESLVGADEGHTSVYFVFENTDGAEDFVAGRIRIVIRGHEV